MKVLVLGCGPAGLLVAHACAQADVEFHVISEKKPSFIAGAQYLHRPIEGLTTESPQGRVRYVKEGSKRGYAMKVYGDSRASTSWDKFDGHANVWHLQGIYESLWGMYQERIFDGTVGIDQLPAAMRDYDLVLSTIPKPALLPYGSYSSEQVWIVDSGICVAPMTIIMNGEPKCRWYRTSNIFGHAFTEYPQAVFVPETEQAARLIKKPLVAVALNPYEEQLYFFGRYGQWKKGVLVDDAYYEAKALLEERL